MKTAETTDAQRELLEHLHWRYATKKFDPSRKIDDQTWATLEEAMRLAPSSYGLQPWKFVVVTDPAIKAKLPAISYNQPQPADCSHLVVLCRVSSLDEAHLDRYVEQTAQLRSLSPEKKDGFRAMMAGFIKKTSDADKAAWSARQSFIALGFLLSAAAMLGVDACPMEGLDRDAYDKLLDLPARGCNSLALCALGYRDPDDYYAGMPKVRFPASETAVRI